MRNDLTEKIKLPLLIVLITISTIYTIHGFSNLIGGPDERLPVDLALRYAQSNDLVIDKINVYQETRHAQYPPSTFGILAVVTAPVSYSYMDEVWALLNFLALIFIATVLYHIPIRKIDKWLLIFSFLSFHSIAHGLGVGQITILVVSATLSAVYVATTWKNYLSFLLATLLLTFALGKYSLLLPFGLIFLLDKNLRIPFISALGINVIVSQIILSRVDSSISGYVQNVITNSGGTASSGTIDIHALLSAANIGPPYTMIGTLCILLLFTLVILRNRKSLNLWEQLALAAITARLFVYHAHYDNVVLIFVVIAISFKVFETNSTDRWSVYLYLLTLFSLIIPARFLIWDAPFYVIFLIFQLILWIGLPFFIINLSSINKVRL